jgi:hypothetical protein
MISILTGKVPNAKLIWIQTEDDGTGGIRATGNVEEFDVNFNETGLEYWQRQIYDTWGQIKKAHEAWEKGDILDILEVMEYNELALQIDELKKKQDELKIKLETDLKKSGMPTFKSDF